MEQSTNDRGILFSGAMVRSLRAGLKTQTRRVVRGPRLHNPQRDSASGLWVTQGRILRPPYGDRHGRLRVKERWRPRLATQDGHEGVELYYAADGGRRFVSLARLVSISPGWRVPPAASRHDLTPLLMPRWASRVDLTIVRAGLEQLQRISPADAVAEGVGKVRDGGWKDHLDPTGLAWLATPYESFESLWRSINGDASWENNPWVWVVEFEPVFSD